MPNVPNNSNVPSGNPDALLQVDQGALKILWANGEKAWKDVESATEWVEELRGNQMEDEPRTPPAT